MTTESVAKEQDPFLHFTPAELTAYITFWLIEKKEFDTLSRVLTEDATFNDPHFGPDPIEGREVIITALKEGFGAVEKIEFNVSKIGQMHEYEEGGIDLCVTVAAKTQTHTVINTGLGEEIETNVGQAFFFSVKQVEGLPMLTSIEAYPQYPPPEGTNDL